MEKLLETIIYITMLIVVVMICCFIIMVIKLIRFDKCNKNNFELSYCEKYKDF